MAGSYTNGVFVVTCPGVVTTMSLSVTIVTSVFCSGEPVGAECTGTVALVSHSGNSFYNYRHCSQGGTTVSGTMTITPYSAVRITGEASAAGTSSENTNVRVYITRNGASWSDNTYFGNSNYTFHTEDRTFEAGYTWALTLTVYADAVSDL